MLNPSKNELALVKMALEARQQYELEFAAGGEPTWPTWTDDLFMLIQEKHALQDRAEGLQQERDEFMRRFTIIAKDLRGEMAG